MALEQRLSLNLKLSQKLIMTPSLQQAIKLLQLNKMELIDTLNQELTENPILEETLQEPGNGSDESTPAEQAATTETTEKEEEKSPFDEIDMEAYFQDYIDSSYSYRSQQGMKEVKEVPSYENFLQKPQTLTDHLNWQLGVSVSDPRLVEAADAVIGNLDEDGYLEASIEELQVMGPFDSDIVHEAIDLIQGFDPPGVAARDLQECLLLQIKRLELTNTPVELMIKDFMELLHKRHYHEIAKKLGVSIDEVGEYLRIVRQLDPKPGLKYNEQASHYVVPDVYVVKIDGEYVVLLNEDGMPRLKLSSFYKNMLNKGNTSSAETKDFIKDKFRSALWLIKSLEQRQRTIFKVAESVVKHQHDFLEKGIDHIRPLVLRDVAEDIEMHESTVSRVVSNKYMHTPRGVFEMKYFFHSGIHSDTGEDISSLSVKQKIRRLIEEEELHKPLSDSAIVKLLKEEGLEIARRTVAKYREEMRIPSSTERRRIL